MNVDQLVRERRIFVALWAYAAEAGWVDAIYGEQFKRVILEWFDAGCPPDISRFILERTNALPPRPC